MKGTLEVTGVNDTTPSTATIEVEVLTMKRKDGKILKVLDTKHARLSDNEGNLRPAKITLSPV